MTLSTPRLPPLRLTLLSAALALAVTLALPGTALADPPSRVARLASTSGAISFSPGGEDEWVQASVNRPLTSGDRVWADAGARAELQLGDTAIRLGANTSLSLLNLDDRTTQVRLAQGRLNLRVRHMARDEGFEVDTPNLALTIRRPGNYRIEVDADGGATSVTVRDGQAEVAAEGSAFMVDGGRTVRFYGAGLRDYETLDLPDRDAIDRWAGERDRRWDDSPSARYVSRELIGYEDLDEHGTWRNVEGYGNVWTPRRVAADWAPYRDGHWAWVEPWGWTWVDAAPWGFAPSHYGRWAHIDRDWSWVPGPVQARPVYAPAVVGFVGDNNLQVALRVGVVAAIAWFALGPHDVYRPSYPVSRDYFGRINSASTVIAPTQITQVYNTINVRNVTNVTNVTNLTNVVYANQQVPGAVVAMPRAAFAQSRSVDKEALPVGREAFASTPVVAVATVTPLRGSVLGAALAPSVAPPQAVWTRPVVAKTAPPPAPVAFAVRQVALAANPGQPLDPAATAAAARQAPAAVAAASTPAQVKLVTAPPPVALPTRPASAAGNPGGPRTDPGPRGEPALSAPARPPAPPMAAPTAVPGSAGLPATSPATSPAPVVAAPPASAAPTLRPPLPASAAMPVPVRPPMSASVPRPPEPSTQPVAPVRADPAREPRVEPLPSDGRSPRPPRPPSSPSAQDSPTRPTDVVRPAVMPSVPQLVPPTVMPTPVPLNAPVARPPSSARPTLPSAEAEPRPPVVVRPPPPPMPVQAQVPMAPRPAPVAPPPPAPAPPHVVMPPPVPPPVPVPPQRGGAEQLRPAPEAARANDRREAASGVKRGEEPRRRNEGEPGRN